MKAKKKSINRHENRCVFSYMFYVNASVVTQTLTLSPPKPEQLSWFLDYQVETKYYKTNV